MKLDSRKIWSLIPRLLFLSCLCGGAQVMAESSSSKCTKKSGGDPVWVAFCGNSEAQVLSAQAAQQKQTEFKNQKAFKEKCLCTGATLDTSRCIPKEAVEDESVTEMAVGHKIKCSDTCSYEVTPNPVSLKALQGQNNGIKPTAASTNCNPPVDWVLNIPYFVTCTGKCDN